jgi:hypothetical protein
MMSHRKKKQRAREIKRCYLVVVEVHVLALTCQIDLSLSAPADDVIR